MSHRAILRLVSSVITLGLSGPWHTTGIRSPAAVRGTAGIWRKPRVRQFLKHLEDGSCGTAGSCQEVRQGSRPIACSISVSSPTSASSVSLCRLVQRETRIGTSTNLAKSLERSRWTAPSARALLRICAAESIGFCSDKGGAGHGQFSRFRTRCECLLHSWASSPQIGWSIIDPAWENLNYAA